MDAPIRRVLAGVLAGIVILAGACGGQEQLRSDALRTSRPVSFAAPDGVRLDGRLFGEGDASAGFVLAHMLPADQSAWYPFAAHLASQGYVVLTFDFRGYCPGGDAGCSEGAKQVETTPVDLQAALNFLRSQGVSRVGLIGASIGGTAAIRVASTEGDGVDALVTLSAPMVLRGLSAGPDELQTVSAAKLFIAGEGDVTAADAAGAFYGASGQPKRYEILPTDDHGTDLLTGGQGQRVIDLIDRWLAGAMPADAPTASPASA